MLNCLSSSSTLELQSVVVSIGRILSTNAISRADGTKDCSCNTVECVRSSNSHKAESTSCRAIEHPVGFRPESACTSGWAGAVTRITARTILRREVARAECSHCNHYVHFNIMQRVLPHNNTAVVLWQRTKARSRQCNANNRFNA